MTFSSYVAQENNFSTTRYNCFHYLLKTLTLPSFLKVLRFNESQSVCVSIVRPERSDKPKESLASGRAGICGLKILENTCRSFREHIVLFLVIWLEIVLGLCITLIV